MSRLRPKITLIGLSQTVRNFNSDVQQQGKTREEFVLQLTRRGSGLLQQKLLLCKPEPQYPARQLGCLRLASWTDSSQSDFMALGSSELPDLTLLNIDVWLYALLSVAAIA